MTASDPAAPDLAEVRSIAVLRANGLGDYLLAEPALDALRAAAPNARITLLGLPWHAEALTGRPGPIDEVVVVPPSAGVRVPTARDPEDPALLAAFFERMRARHFDLAVQLHGGGRYSNPFVRGLGAAWAVGTRSEDAEPLDATVHFEYWQHEVARYLEVVGLVGATPRRIYPHLEVTAQDDAAAVTALAERGADPEAATVVLHPGATDPRRRWPGPRFAEVGRRLHGLGAQVVVIGAGQECGLAAEVARHGGAIDLSGALPHPALIGLLRRARLVVANDSGPRHLAEAVGTATVSIYWFGNLVNAGPLRRDRHVVHVSWTTACPICGTPCVGSPPPSPCEHDEASFVADVPLEPVCRSVARGYARSHDGGGSAWEKGIGLGTAHAPER